MADQQETVRGELIPASEAAARRLEEQEPRPPAQLPAVQTGPAALMEIIGELRRNPNFNISDLRELLAMKAEWEREENRKAYRAALARAQANMPVVTRNVHVYFESKKEGVEPTDYRHAGYGNLVDTIKGCLSAEGLSYDHNVIQQDGQVTVECILSHELGHSQKVVMSAPPDATGGKNAIQAIKSTRTYLKRSTFEDVTGAVIDDADDDGHGYGGGVETITDEQLAHLEDELEKLGATSDDRDKFLSFLSKKAKREITDLADLPAPAFLTAKQGLAAKRKQKTVSSEDVAAYAEAENARLEV